MNQRSFFGIQACHSSDLLTTYLPLSIIIIVAGVIQNSVTRSPDDWFISLGTYIILSGLFLLSLSLWILAFLFTSFPNIPLLPIRALELLDLICLIGQAIWSLLGVVTLVKVGHEIQFDSPSWLVGWLVVIIQVLMICARFPTVTSIKLE